jgi:hypothetical protein
MGEIINFMGKIATNMGIIIVLIVAKKQPYSGRNK